MIDAKLYQPFILSLVLGAMLGFERAFAARINERDDDLLGGIRTFSLISLFGCIAAFLDSNFREGILIVSYIGLMLLTGISYLISFGKHDERGITTEISLFICFTIGVLVQQNYFILATFITIFVMLVLYLKEYMNRVTKKIESEDIHAVLKFAIITFVILPVFDPRYALHLNDIFDPGRLTALFPGIDTLEILNPHIVWLMVVLISGIGFIGYIATKILGSRKGIGLTGLLGGMVSSTATTITFSKRSMEEERLSLSFSLAILLACSTMFPRILVEVLVVNASLLPSLSVTMGLMALSGFTVCFFLWKRSGRETSDEVPLKNPFSIMPAVKFALLYAVIVFLARFMEVVAGDSGLYIVSVLSGLTDVDAITLSMSQLSKQNPAKLQQASVAITLAAFSNTIMKGGMVFMMGSQKLKKIILAGFISIILSGIAGLVILAIV